MKIFLFYLIYYLFCYVFINQEYDVSKMVERKYKITFTGKNKDKNISAQNAQFYSRRFVRFITSNIIEDNDKDKDKENVKIK